MPKPYYVVLTGAKNNGGDFLIAARSKRLLGTLRPDRDLVEYNRWEPFGPERLEKVSGAAALLLTGGPALQPDMYPGVYPLVDDLDAIPCPILTFGIGWKSPSGTWDDARNYPLSAPTKTLLARIEKSGFASSLRDYHSAATVERHGFTNFRVTGCPALFLGTQADTTLHTFTPDLVRRIGVSLGVEFVLSPQFEAQTRAVIAACQTAFPRAEVIVSFHHASGQTEAAAPTADRFWTKHRRFRAWLARTSIRSCDVSGSAERLAAFYDSVDLHIGYRVHAHIYMLSVGRPSVLVAEDGRGMALREVVGGAIFDAFSSRSRSVVARGLRALHAWGGYRMNPTLIEDITEMLADPVRFNRQAAAAQAAITAHYDVLCGLVRSWP